MKRSDRDLYDFLKAIRFDLQNIWGIPCESLVIRSLGEVMRSLEERFESTFDVEGVLKEIRRRQQLRNETLKKTEY